MHGQPPALYFEDIEVGQTWDLGEDVISREEMLEFAERYDPEPFHVDEAWSRAESQFGDIIGSGLLTLAKCRLLNHRCFTPLGGKFLVAAGFEYLRFVSPTRPGDRMHARSECIAKRASRTKPDRGTVTFRITASNQHGQVLLEFAPIVLIQRRSAASRSEIREPGA